MDGYNLKTKAELQAERDAKQEASEENRNRMGAALLGGAALGGVGYLGYNALGSAANKVDSFEAGQAVGSGVVKAGQATVDAATYVTKKIKDGVEYTYDSAGRLIDSTEKFYDGVIHGTLNESSLKLDTNHLTFITENSNSFGQKVDKALDFAKSNAGMIAGGVLGAGAGILGMSDEVNGQEVTTGAKLLGAGVLGTAGAGVGHVIHNQIKKNNMDYKDYKNYKDMINPSTPSP
jgi:hypothetical protein